MLSRRDTLLALASVTTALGASGYVRSTQTSQQLADEPRDVATAERVATVTAVAAVVYPSAVDVDERFVKTAVFGRIEPYEGHFDGLAAAVDTIERYTRPRFGVSFAALPLMQRHRILEEMGVYAVHATPHGTAAERIRYFLINDLLYALFTHPMGSELLGVHNPPGYFGGNELYQRGPSRASTETER
jgi:hypothetical protein